MSNDLLPFSDDQARAVQEVAKTGREALERLGGLGGYLKEIFGYIPKDLMGWAVGDRLQMRRLQNAAKIAGLAQQILDRRQVKDRETTGLLLGRALLDAAGNEDRAALQEIWSKLLAAAMDPNRSSRVRTLFVRIVKDMDPIDALIFQSLQDRWNGQPNQRDFLAGRFKWRPDEIETSFGRLQELGLGVCHAIGNSCSITPRGRELLRALSE
jgi:hypothetical protein